jgi:gamma-glutamyltranspeptidase/glutathione hydrolase
VLGAARKLFASAPPLLVACGLWFALPAASLRAAEPSGAAASEHPLVTRAALDVLEKGGNAADAAVAAALMAGVVSPSSSGLGGGGFALVSRPGTPEPVVLDFREVAPKGVDAAVLDRRPLAPPERGHLVGVPGEARGLDELIRRFGKRSWSELVAPAERRARLGYPVGAHLARTLKGFAAAELKRETGLASLFYPRGQALAQGALVKNPKLASTLKRLGAEGPRALYEGAIAAELVSTARAAGSSLSAEDLLRYGVKERKPLHLRWADYELYTMPLPSAGGLLLAETLGMWSREQLAALGYQSGAYQHALAETFRSAFLDRFRYIGDPDFVPVNEQNLLASERLAKKRSALSLDRTHALPTLAQTEHGTHHMVCADRDGMVVSLTTTVNRVFGSKLLAPESGIVLNDQLDDFTAARDAELLGVTSNPNMPRPEARPVSSMTPTIVFRDGKPVLALGGSGGMAISTNVTQLLLGRLAFDRPIAELVQTPRFYVPTQGASTLLLEDGAPPALLADLAYRGERIGKAWPVATAVQMLARTATGWEAAADPRKFGLGATSR